MSADPVLITVKAGEFVYLYLRAADSMVVANATAATVGGPCVFSSSKKISISAAGGDPANASHKVLLDYLNGPFAVGSAAAPGIDIDLVTTGINEVMFRGTTDQDIFILGTKGTDSYVGYASAASNPTSPTFASVIMANVSDITITTGPGADVIDGQATGLVAPASVLALSGDINLTVFGGAGDDTITSGTAGKGMNSLNGNAGNDLFPQPTGVLAHDVISGGDDPNATLTTVGTSTGAGTGTDTASATNTLTNTQTASTTKSYTGTGTVTAAWTGTAAGTTTSSKSVTATATATGTATYTGTYLGIDAAGAMTTVTKSFTATLTGTNTVTSTLTVTATGANSATASKTATGSAVGSGTKSNTQTYTAVVTTSTVTSLQTDTSIDVVDYSHRAGAVKVTLGDESYDQAASATVVLPKSSAIRNYDGFTINDGDIASTATTTNTGTGTFTYTATKTDGTTETKTTSCTSVTRFVEFHRTGQYNEGTITAPTDASDLANDDTVTINDGNHTVVFHLLLVDTNNQTGTTTATDTKLHIQIPDTAVQSDIATAIANGIKHYQTSTWTGTATGTATRTSVSIVPNVTVNDPDSTNNYEIDLQGRKDGAAGALVATNNTDIVTSTATSTSVWTANLNAAVVNISNVDPPTVGGDTASGVATKVAAAITTAAGEDINVTASATGSVLTVTAGGTHAVKALFAISVKSGGFAVTPISSGTPVGGPGANDGDVSGERDSIMYDVETVIGGSGDDIIDASQAGTVAHQLFGMSGADTLIIGAASNVASVLYGGPGADHLIGGSAADSLYGGDDNDFLAGGPGNDTIEGDGPNCVVASTGVYASTLCTTGYAASMYTSPATGANYLDYSDRTADVTVNLATMATDSQVGVSGEKDTVTSCSHLRGGSGNDNLTGDASANIIYGGPGDDQIYGAGGPDTLYGDEGNDAIEGGAGNDAIYGGAGFNTLYGDSSTDPTVVGYNMLDNSDGRKGAVKCGNTIDMGILFSDGEESGTETCQLNLK